MICTYQRIIKILILHSRCAAIFPGVSSLIGTTSAFSGALIVYLMNCDARVCSTSSKIHVTSRRLVVNTLTSRQYDSRLLMRVASRRVAKDAAHNARYKNVNAIACHLQCEIELLRHASRL